MKVAFYACFLTTLSSGAFFYLKGQEEYGYVGYPLYALLSTAAVAGIGVGMLQPHRNKESLKHVLPALQRKLAAVTLLLLFIFIFIVTCQIAGSDNKYYKLIISGPSS